MTNKELLKVIEEAKASGATVLDLSNKQLTELPLELFRLTNLIKLDLGGNQLTILPPEIGQLRNLQHLIILHNKLSTIPPEISQLTNLTTLSFGYNQLTALPSEIGQLRGLTELYLYFNKVTTLPSAIGQLRNLTKLSIGWNQLTSLPDDICQLTKLEELHINGNPLTAPPPELIHKGIEAIRQYFAALKGDKRLLNEVKVLLVGDGAAGKTSLVKRLLGEVFDANADTTHGISIRNWSTRVESKAVRVNLWDFGGQEIMHATHQFFLSKRSLYVLVLDGRKDEEAEYWLRHIEAFGGDSPIIVVLNKMDANPSFEVNRAFLREKYHGIRSFCQLSCKTNSGIKEFREELLKELAQVQMLEILWPKSWFQVKELLRSVNRPYLTSEEYETICDDEDITEQASQDTLVDFLHDLGVVVHFKDLVLNTMHVLDPIWVTNAVYNIITSKKMVITKGFLHLKHLEKILPHAIAKAV